MPTQSPPPVSTPPILLSDEDAWQLLWLLADQPTLSERVQKVQASHPVRPTRSDAALLALPVARLCVQSGMPLLNHVLEEATEYTEMGLPVDLLVERLLERGASPHTPNPLRTDRMMQGRQSPPLHLALRAGSWEAMRALLAHGADSMALDNRGDTVLFRVAQSPLPTLQAYHALVAMGVDPFHINREGRRCFDRWGGLFQPHTATCVLREIAIDLLARGLMQAPLGERSESPLHVFAETEALAVVLAHHADVHARNRHGQTPLHLAAWSDGPDDDVAAAVAHLLTAGADVHARDHLGRTPLHQCTGLPALNQLLAEGAEVDARCQRGRTALEYHLLHCLNNSSHIDNFMDLAPVLHQKGAVLPLRLAPGEPLVLEAMVSAKVPLKGVAWVWKAGRTQWLEQRSIEQWKTWLAQHLSDTLSEKERFIEWFAADALQHTLAATLPPARPSAKVRL